ncbi:MAG: virulence protein RhuM/Fic/DOC family protein [Clostridia bacterium]
MDNYIQLENGVLKLNNISEDEVLLSKKQIAKLYNEDEYIIAKYLKNNVGYNNFKKVKLYNLDVIIKVGFMVKNEECEKFRNNYENVIKEYITKGYVVNSKKIDYLKNIVKENNDISNNINKIIEDDEFTDIFKITKSYTNALNMLEKYDSNKLKKPMGNKSIRKIEYSMCKEIILNMQLQESSKIFGIERDMGLDSIINNIYQSFKGKDVYPTIEEKTCNFLYLIVKNHVFIDGNKRIGAILFIYFLNFYNLFRKNNANVISPETLIIVTLFIAQSNPREKESIIDLLMNLLDNSN